MNTYIKKLDLSSNHLGDAGMDSMVMMLVENLYITDLVSFRSAFILKHLVENFFASLQR